MQGGLSCGIYPKSSAATIKFVAENTKANIIVVDSEEQFQKVRQVYLLKHMYDLERVPKADFGVLLGYIEGLKGRSRADCLTEARRCGVDVL